MLDSLFRPKAVAVIGASTKELTIGNRIIRNLTEFDFKGAIYPINPKGEEVRGLKTYRSILDVPTDVDVVHMVIPAKLVPQAIEDCGKKAVKFVILNGGGFAEVGPEGAAIEQACILSAKRNGIRIMGPNCQGIINTDPEVRAYCNFTFTRPDIGFISIVALSGGVAELIHQAFSEMGVGTRLYASNGNACDVSIPEILEYYGEDEGTRVIVLYVEGLREPDKFLQAAAKVAAKKPILAMKAGRTKEGATAAASHTGGLAREDISTDLIFEKTGILSFRDVSELCNAAVAFSSQPIPHGNRVGMITNAGGPAVISTDELVAGGLKLAHLSDRTVEYLKGKMYPEVGLHNPLDVLATAGPDHFRAALDAMVGEDQVDNVYVNMVTPFFVDTDGIARQVVQVNKQGIKPLIVNLITDRRQRGETVRILRDGGVAFYSMPGTAARAMAALNRYNAIRSRPAGQVRTFDDVDRARAEAIILQAQGAGRKMLSAAEAYGVLQAYGISVADWRIAQDAAEAEKAAAEIGFPVVVKADAESIVHKSDMGGVAVNLKEAGAVRGAVQEMSQKLQAEDMRFFVQKYLPGGREVIVGAKAEEGLGHLILFGMGGIYVEILKDVAFKLAPVTNIEAQEMLSSIKMAPLLKGVRGEKGVNEKALVETLQRVSQLVTEFPMIDEMDLNPIIAFEDGSFVVDARISVKR
ncbi:MAG: acetate--CoA ligase family protein [Chloroflexi bacterium]|nr:acetate--CoA ligase family protein [Chloroflexota bacterium]